MGEAAASIARERKRVTAIPEMGLTPEDFSVVFRLSDGTEICFDMDYKTALGGITDAQKTFLLGRVVPWVMAMRPQKRKLRLVTAGHATDS